MNSFKDILKIDKKNIITKVALSSSDERNIDHRRQVMPLYKVLLRKKRRVRDN